MLFVSGQGPLDPATKQAVDGDIQIQTRRTLSNLRSILEAAGTKFSDVVNIRVILRDVRDFKQFNEVFRQEIGTDKVTRTCVGGIPHRDGVNIEIDCVAMFDQPWALSMFTTISCPRATSKRLGKKRLPARLFLAVLRNGV
jgi:2-iminobutanoate/2-iminopropanoate deaminase